MDKAEIYKWHDPVWIDRVTEFEIALIKLYGAVVTTPELWRVLGYQSAGAFRQAIYIGRVPVQTFKVEGRRERFARTHDIAMWLVSLDAEIPGDSSTN